MSFKGGFFPNAGGGGGGGVSDHGALTGLTDDDHTQYLLADASRVATGAQTFRRTAVGTGTTDGAVVENSTDAAAGAQQYSPLLRLRGSGWKTNATAAAQSVDFALQVRPVQGAANPTGALHWLSQINGGGYTSRMNLASDGSLQAGNDTDTTNIFGRTRLDSRATDEATFSHFDCSAADQEAVKQTAAGETHVNSKTGQELIIKIGGAAAFRVTSGRFIQHIAANQQTTVGAAGGASALPATPLGYFLQKTSAGTTVAIPYYNAA